MRIKFIGARPSASGVVDYLMDTLHLNDKKAKILDGAGVDLSTSPKESVQQCASNIATSFDIQSSMRPTISKPLLHLSISWLPGEEISNEQMQKAAMTTLHRLGLDSAQYLLVRHDERPHPHMHILVNTIMADGKVQRIPHPLWYIFREISLVLTFANHWQRGFYKALSKSGKKNGKGRKKMASDNAKMQVAKAVCQALTGVRSVEELPDMLSRITGGRTTAKIEMSRGNEKNLPTERIIFHHLGDNGKEYTFNDKYWDWHCGYAELQDVLLFNNQIVDEASKAQKVLAEYSNAKKTYKFSDKYETAARKLKITLSNYVSDAKEIKEILHTPKERRIYLTMMHFQDLRGYCDILSQGMSAKAQSRAKRIKEFNYNLHETKKRGR